MALFVTNVSIILVKAKGGKELKKILRYQKLTNIDTFDEELQSHITMLMATDFEIENMDKAVEDILIKYEREKLKNIEKRLDKLENM